MNNSLRLNLRDQAKYSLPVPDIDFMVVKLREILFQAPLVPASISGGAEENCPLIIVNAMDFMAQPVKIRTDLGSDQSG
jgi:hypothetical protein